MAETLYNQTYSGPRWTYGARLRPISYANAPDGWVVYSQRKDHRFPVFGIVDYPFELTPEQVDRFDMVLLASPKPEPEPAPAEPNFIAMTLTHVGRIIRQRAKALGHGHITRADFPDNRARFICDDCGSTCWVEHDSRKQGIMQGYEDCSLFGPCEK